CCSVPQRRKAFTKSVFCTATSTPTDASIAEISSTARIAPKKVPSLPPYSMGISIPISPRLKSCGNRSAEKCCSSSIWRTRGPMLCCANSRTVERKSCSSSFSCVSGNAAGVVSVSDIGTSEGGKPLSVAEYEGNKPNYRISDCQILGKSSKIKGTRHDILTARSSHWDFLCLLPACNFSGLLGSALEARRPKQSGRVGS